MVDSIHPPRCLDQLALSVTVPVPPVVEGEPTLVGGTPLAAHPISTVVPLVGTHSGSVDTTKDSKEGIILDVYRLQAKRKVVLAMGEMVTGALNIGKQI